MKSTEADSLVRQKCGKIFSPGLLTKFQFASYFEAESGLNRKSIIDTRAQCHKTFLSVIYKLSQEARLGCKSLPGTNTCLLRKFVNHRQKSFITLAPGSTAASTSSRPTATASGRLTSSSSRGSRAQCYKTFTAVNLRMFVIS